MHGSREYIDSYSIKFIFRLTYNIYRKYNYLKFYDTTKKRINNASFFQIGKQPHLFKQLGELIERRAAARV